MALEVVMPRMGLTMEEGTLIAWLKQEGEPVIKGETLFEIETDKSTVEVESLGNGILGRIISKPGDTLPVGAVMAYIVAEGEAIPTPSTATRKPDAEPEQSAAAAASHTQNVSSGENGKVRASPAARHLAHKRGIDLHSIAGTGPGGRIVAWNVEEAVQAAKTKHSPTPVMASPLAQRVAADLGVDLADIQGSGKQGRITRADVEKAAAQSPTPVSATQVITPSRRHQLMADRMTHNFGTAPHFYLHAEVDARPLIALRESLVKKLEARTGLRVTYSDLLVKLCATALEDHPEVMAQWANDKLVQPDAINIGLAVDMPEGLIVPVIHNAEQLSLTAIAQRRQDITERARSGKLLPSDLELGVFTISNLGIFRVDWFEAILNSPEPCILAIGRITERPWVENGQIVAASTMRLSLSIDHRVLDGATGARFLTDLVDLIETPGLALA